MKKLITSIIIAAITAVCATAQSSLKKIYDEDINQLEQIDKAIRQASDEGKFVICQVGGNWCRWCLMFADYIEKDAEISDVIDRNFVYIHVNYNPKKPSDETVQKMMKKLGNPGRFGFPALVVMDGKGKILHTQDSSLLEEGNGYNKDKVLRFFRNWTPEAVAQ